MEMIRRRLLFPGACSLLTLLPTTVAAVNSMLFENIESLPVAIRSIQLCGQWTRGAEEGRYRVIVGDVSFGAGQELYVQWITAPTADRASRIVATVPIRELNDDHDQYEIEQVRCVVTARVTRILVRVVNEHDEAARKQNVSIRLTDDNRYVLEKPPRR